MNITRALIVDNSKLTQAITSSFLEELGIACDLAQESAMVWQLIKRRSEPYQLVLVSRATLGKDLPIFVSRFRALRQYAATPMILLLNDKEKAVESMYANGFTQIFSRKEFPLLRDYVLQIQSRDTFEKKRHNKVVIIEDDYALQLTIQTILEENHCECFCFNSAEAALDAVDSIQPQAISCDFFLEGKMTGLDFVCQIKQDSHPWSQVPVLVMTGLDDTARKSELVRSGANDYLAKPIDPLDLTVRIENLIRYHHLLTKVEEQKKAMQYLAMHDQLTGVYNRHFIAEQVHISIRDAKRHQTPYSLIVLDIDYFKSINDRYGHDKGDQVLQAVAGLISGLMRGDDIVARVGGEEFLILLNHCGLAAATEKAEALRLCIERSKPAGLPLSASFGVAELSDQTADFDMLFKAADQAVYRAKELGRNRVEMAQNQPLSKQQNCPRF